MLIDLLLQAGLNSTEAEVYLTLYEHRRLTPTAISEITGIKRTTVYAAADELVKKAIVSIEHGKNKRFYTVDSTSSLLKYIELKEEDIRKKKNAIKKAITSLSEIPRSKAIPTPKVRIVTEANIEDFLYKQTAIWEKSMKDTKQTTWWGFQDTSLVEFPKYQKWILWYWKRAPKIFELKMFSNDADVEKNKSLKKIKRRQIRIWNDENPVTVTYWVLGDYVISIITNIKSHYLVQMHDPILAHNMRQLYKKVWYEHKDSKKYNKTT
ncbi:hypothetical protein KC901_00010 [Patescibacteria group bacterium]|nr:hypothetical protein [Patescibacteria group bacterium]